MTGWMLDQLGFYWRGETLFETALMVTAAAAITGKKVDGLTRTAIETMGEILRDLERLALQGQTAKNYRVSADGRKGILTTDEPKIAYAGK